MNVVITGGAGFLGVRLARTLLAQGQLSLASASPQAIARITLVDRAQPPADLLTDPRIAAVVGDLNDLLQPGPTGTAAMPAGTHLVFHLAAAVSGECEADFDLGMRSNLDATRALLEACRALKTRPTFVFASSLAVFGKPPGQELPEVIEDSTLPTPQSSYGIQKFIGEQLVADYARKGFVRGRNVRLMTVSVRPGQAQWRGIELPERHDPRTTGRRAGRLPGAGRHRRGAVLARSHHRGPDLRGTDPATPAWGPLTAMNLPALRTTVGEMAAALGRVAGTAATDLLDWTPDPAILSVVSTWPGNIASTRARALGLLPDSDFETIIRDYIRENPDAIRLPVQP